MKNWKQNREPTEQRISQRYGPVENTLAIIV